MHGLVGASVGEEDFAGPKYPVVQTAKLQTEGGFIWYT